MTNMTNMTNMYDMTNMSNIQKICKSLSHMNTPFSILPILQICNKYEHPYFNIPKNIKYEKNAEYDIHPPGLPAAGRPGAGTKKYDK